MQATASLQTGPTDEPVMQEKEAHPFCLPRKAAHNSFCLFLTVGFGEKNQCLCSKWGDKPQESVLQVALMLSVTALSAYPFLSGVVLSQCFL